MALNNSGPISMGGPIVGQSISLELGRAFDAEINLNESEVRALAGIASGQISLFDFYGKSSLANYISTWGPTSSSSLSYYNAFIALDSATGDIFISAEAAVPQRAQYLKFSNEGLNLIQKTYDNGDPSTRSILPTVIQSSDDNFTYEFGYFSVFNAQSDAYMLSRSKSTSASSLKFKLSGGTDIDQVRGAATYGVAPNSFIYVLSNSRNLSASVVTKFSYTGAVQWQRRILQSFPSDLVCDSQGNIYALGYYGSTFPFNGYLIKFDPTGTVLWQKTIQNLITNNITCDAFNNVYVTSAAASGTGYFIHKLDSNGNFLWGVAGPAASGPVIARIKTDSQRNVYFSTIYYNLTGFGNGQFITKYDENGTLIWARQVQVKNSFGDYEIGFGASIDCYKTNIYASGSFFDINYGNASRVYLLSMPQSGTIVGDFENWRIREFTFTPQAYSASIIAGTMTIDTQGMTVSTFSPLDTTTTHPYSIIAL